jgi:hypothetical protein
MGLDELTTDVEAAYADLGDELAVDLDAETRNELAVLSATLEPDGTDELLRRAVHMLFQTAVDAGNLDFHLRRGYGVTYDEYLYAASNNTGNMMEGDDDRRYQF